MATSFEPPPTYAEPVITDEKTKKAVFNPIWLKWFIDVANFISANGGGGPVTAVNQLLAGTGLTISPAGGTGIVTITVSGSVGHGEMIVVANATGLVLTLQNTYYQWTAGFTSSENVNWTMNGSNQLVCGSAGNYFTTCAFTINSSSSNQVYRISIFKNGVELPNHLVRMKLINSTDLNSGTIVGVTQGIALNDVFDLRLLNETSAGQTAIISYANFSILAIS